MTTQQNPAIPRPAARFLWLTFDFAHCLTTDVDDITPQLFLTLMTHPAISQIKRFTAGADNLGPDDIAQWEPGLFTVQAYRASLGEVLSHVSSLLAPHLMADSPAADSPNPTPLTIKIYTQMGGRHYPITTHLGDDAIKMAAEEIETMVQQYEKDRSMG
ncbi:hypothetical protein [Leptothoe sp. PORK10 BA2]|uniref:hypothetical protein n=1 Tax=Leptothoe sp. PORK10 BA2 TaxID=3110254 RepID=UPI002B2065F7|nr:hypothetical protein [Leptothoe sp. PORK10 BA2]MEA5464395.1 hypothetical protein [Leptothoe sp. PORK10 BA2]